MARASPTSIEDDPGLTQNLESRVESGPLGGLYLDEGDLAEDKEGCSLLLLLVVRRIGNKIGGLQKGVFSCFFSTTRY
jgi:hypothetical protein